MLNQERIILMTKMAAYEKKEAGKNVAIGNYFRSDYIGIQVLISVFCATIAFGIVLALYIFYDFETFMQNIYKMDLISFATNVLTYYGITVVTYGLIAYGVCSYRYAKAKKSLKGYYKNLKKLSTLYSE